MSSSPSSTRLDASGPALLPCPFCGGKAYSTRTVNGTQMFKVGCSPCGFELKAAWYRDAEQPTKDLVALWNHRAAAPALEGARDATGVLRTEEAPPIQNVRDLRAQYTFAFTNGGVAEMDTAWLRLSLKLVAQLLYDGTLLDYLTSHNLTAEGRQATIVGDPREAIENARKGHGFMGSIRRPAASSSSVREDGSPFTAEDAKILRRAAVVVGNERVWPEDVEARNHRAARLRELADLASARAPLSETPPAPKPQDECANCGDPHWKHLGGPCSVDRCVCKAFRALSPSREAAPAPSRTRAVRNDESGCIEFHQSSSLQRDASERPTGDLLLTEVLRLANPFDLPCAEVAWDAEHQHWDVDWMRDRSQTVSVTVERDHVYWAALLGEESRNGSSQKDPDTFAKITAALHDLACLPATRPAGNEGERRG